MQVPAELLEKADMSTLVIINVALAALGVLIVNAALVAFFIIRRRNKGLFYYLWYYFILQSVPVFMILRIYKSQS